MRVNNWTICIQAGVNGRERLRRPKLSNGEVVAPEEEKEEVEEERIGQRGRICVSCNGTKLDEIVN